MKNIYAKLSHTLSRFSGFIRDLPRTGANNKFSQSGRSMIEMLGVLAIIGVLTVGGIAGYSKAMEKHKINKALDQISQIINNTRTLFAQHTSYHGICKAEDLGIFSNGITGTGGCYGNLGIDIFYFNSPLNPSVSDGNTFLYVLDSFSPRAVLLQIGLDGDKEACAALASYDWKTALGDSAVAVGVSDGPMFMFFSEQTISSLTYAESTAYGSTGVFAPVDHLPISMDTVAGVCNDLNANSTLGIVFK